MADRYLKLVIDILVTVFITLAIHGRSTTCTGIQWSINEVPAESYSDSSPCDPAVMHALFYVVRHQFVCNHITAKSLKRYLVVQPSCPKQDCRGTGQAFNACQRPFETKLKSLSPGQAL